VNSIQSIACPKCGSPDLTTITWNQRKCNHCGTVSVLSDDRQRLELVGWICPQCGFNNERATTFCGKCGTPLVKICPRCLAEIRFDLEFCSKCGAGYESLHKVLYDALQRALDQGKNPSHGTKYLTAVLKLDQDDKTALCLRGQMHFNESHWREAVADWGRVYRSDCDYPLVRRLLKEFVDRNLYFLTRPGFVDNRLKNETDQRYLKAIRSKFPSPLP
jgi:predicted RNA-binding Zn-ribbon protein involved in translation (DUF1610 family)